MPKRIKKLGLILILTGNLWGQTGVSYPTEEYFGGGIGYTPMFLQMNVAEAFPFNSASSSTDTGLLGASGLNFADLTALGELIVMHGAEGFGNISRNFRLGAYVGQGGNSITRIDTSSNLEIDLQVNLMTGSASAEFVVPIFSNLEIAAGSLFGMSRATIQISRTASTPYWADQFSGTDTTNSMVSLSGTFFSFQPYIAVKLQFLNRAGLRVTAGYNVGTVPKNKWVLDGATKIIAPSPGNFNALAVRVMLYIGI